jgi:hypothetical protein
MSSWKKFERRVAKRLGMTRRPVTGIDRNDGDCFNALFEVQCKKRAGQPAYLREWLAGIVETAKAKGRIGFVIWKEPGKGRPDDDALVVLTLRDWEQLHGSLNEPPKRNERLAEAARRFGYTDRETEGP